MTNTIRSRLADLKVIGLVVGITGGLAGISWRVVDAFAAKMDRTEAETSRTVLHKRITHVDNKAEKNKHDVQQVQQTIGRDVRTIKCILTAPNKRAKANCALED